MSLDVAHRDLGALLDRLAPYARSLVERAGVHALRLHAEIVAPEHVLSTLMDDARCAAHACVLHAFADPETISSEALAISPGLLVVASSSTLPFSPRAVEVLGLASARSLEAGRSEIAIADLLAESEDALDDPTRSALRSSRDACGGGTGHRRASVAHGSPAFKRLSPPAKRALSSANRLAASERASAISPAHLLLACLKEDPEAALAAGLSFGRARSALAGHTEDPSLPASRLLPPDPALVQYLSGLVPGSDSLALLARFHSEATPELALILNRSKVSAALVERARGSFLDPG